MFIINKFDKNTATFKGSEKYESKLEADEAFINLQKSGLFMLRFEEHIPGNKDFPGAEEKVFIRFREVGDERNI